MVWEERSIVEKIIKLFSDENIILNKNFNGRKPDIWFKNHNFIFEFDERNHENYDSDDEKERKDMFKNHSFKIFWWNPNDPNFDQHYAKKLLWMEWLIKLLKTLKK